MSRDKEEPVLKCKDCGAEDVGLSEEGLCPVCDAKAHNC